MYGAHVCQSYMPCFLLSSNLLLKFRLTGESRAVSFFCLTAFPTYSDAKTFQCLLRDYQQTEMTISKQDMRQRCCSRMVQLLVGKFEGVYPLYLNNIIFTASRCKKGFVIYGLMSAISGVLSALICMSHKTHARTSFQDCNFASK